MRAFTLDSFERPAGLREDLPTPQAGPGQLLVRVQASSVNPVDAGIAGGHLKDMFPHKFPVLVGRDYAGSSSRSAPTSPATRPGMRCSGSCQG
jgi:NADPH2:quinone reductase